MTGHLLANESIPGSALLSLRAAGGDVESMGGRAPSASDAEVFAVLDQADFVAGQWP